ncbi:MAG: reverse transcriptase family protein, partial [Proteobacteria bacterium]|nr:reverse transcriptase family protein [Pseudomonadota bacterium]
MDNEKKFITSPADISEHRKPELQDAKVSEEDKEQFKQLCEEFTDVFSKSSEDIGRTPLVTMDIETGDSPPICQKPYNLALKHVEWVQKELQILENAGVIVRSISPWASLIVIVPKKSEPGEPPKRRMCVDYRMLNSLLPPVKKAHSKAKGVSSFVPLPKIDEIYGKLKGARIFSALDMRSGYYHIGLTPEAQPKTAFVVGGPQGTKYEFKVVPFGLTQAPAYFQKLIGEVLKGLPFAFGYLDDILVYSPDMETHLEHMRIIFERLREAKLKLKESKCSFLKAHIQYLGHIISGEGIEPVPEKLESIKNMPSPTTPKEVKQFLGLIGYYRKFIPRFADIA